MSCYTQYRIKCEVFVLFVFLEMIQNRYLCGSLALILVVLGVVLVFKFTNTSNEIDANEVNGITKALPSNLTNVSDQIEGQCAGLTSELVKEIKSYQPLVHEIANAIVGNGNYSGDTWNA